MNPEIINLFKKYYHDQCNSAELETVMALFVTGNHLQEWDLVLKEEAQKVIQENLQSEISAGEISTLHDKIMQSIGEPHMKIVKLPKRQSQWKKFAVAASIVLVASFSYYFYTNKPNAPKKTLSSLVNDIAPGKNGGTLTLANGKEILISAALAGDIADESNVRISKTADGQIVYELSDNNSGSLAYNTLSTSRGEQTQVRLPDGTLVFLNAESSLRYPVSFTKLDKREVSLTGEGYFEVAKDKLHPFIVKSNMQTVEVLGTHFNINTYHDEPAVKTTLLEGSVSVRSELNNVMINPGEQARLTGNQFAVSKVDLDEVVAWKDGIFQFSDESLESIMRKISRWYDVEIEYTNDEVKNLPLTGIITHDSNASKVLRMLELTKQVNFKIEGKKIIVMNNKNN